MTNQILPVLFYVCSTIVFLARLPIKLTLFFAAFGMTEEFWPSTHSPMLLLSIILHQTDRLGHHDESLPLLVRLLIAVAFDRIKLIDWVLIFVLAALWHYTARPRLDNRAAWRVIRRRQRATVVRVIAVMRNFCTIQVSLDCLASERKMNHADKDEASTTTSGKSEDLQKETDGEDLLWTEMDNAPPLDGDTRDPCLVPLPLSPFFMAEGIFRALRTDSLDDTMNF